MKSVMALVAVGLLASAGAVDARQDRANDVDETKAFERLDALSDSLSDEQIEALSQVQGETFAVAWDNVADVLNDRQLLSLERAVDDLGGFESELAAEAYLPTVCFATAKVGLLFSLVGYIGCPGDIAREASANAWAAGTYSGACFADGDDECEDAVRASFYSASAWSTLQGSCSVADTAYYSEWATFRTCGGPKEGYGQEPTPTPAPTPTPPIATPAPSPAP